MWRTEQARGSLQAVRKRGEESLTAAAALRRLRALESEAGDEPPAWAAKLGRPGTGASVSLQSMMSSDDAQVLGAVPNLGTLLEVRCSLFSCWVRATPAKVRVRASETLTQGKARPNPVG